MFWRIMPHAMVCIASDKLFLLDLRQDRYFAVPASLLPTMRDWLERNFSCAPPEAVLALLKHSRIFRGHDPEPTNALKELVVIPSKLIWPEAAAEMRLSRFWQTAAITATWLRLRLQPLRRILAARSDRPPLAIGSRSGAVSSLAALYDQGRSFTPITRNCLLDSLALDGLLARRGLGATLVFGVCPTPFSAHCWLQTPDLILNDSFDHVSRFTPIYAS